jgi:hypothetical protein
LLEANSLLHNGREDHFFKQDREPCAATIADGAHEVFNAEGRPGRESLLLGALNPLQDSLVFQRVFGPALPAAVRDGFGRRHAFGFGG